MHSLKVTEVQSLTADSVAVSFEVPEDLKDTFRYKPGQYLTLQCVVEGERLRRSYSLCSSPVGDEILRVGVKRVKEGRVSNYINDHVQVGDVIDVLPPDGKFYAEIKEDNYKTYYLFSAGSGITPVLSILKSVLLAEKHSFVHLLYGNSHQESIMFKEELDQLQELYADRLVLTHCLSRPKTSWWGNSDFDYRKGRVDPEAIRWFIDTYPPYAQNAEYYICGPGKMLESTQQALLDIDVPAGRIFLESFGGEGAKSDTKGVINARLRATIYGTEADTTIAEGKTLLRALIDAGYDPPYSCEGGVCSTCKCKVLKGKVSMRNNLALTDKEVDNGYILSCQSIPMSDEIEIEYTLD